MSSGDSTGYNSPMDVDDVPFQKKKPVPSQKQSQARTPVSASDEPMDTDDVSPFVTPTPKSLSALRRRAADQMSSGPNSPAGITSPQPMATPTSRRGRPKTTRKRTQKSVARDGTRESQQQYDTDSSSHPPLSSVSSLSSISSMEPRTTRGGTVLESPTTPGSTPDKHSVYDITHGRYQKKNDPPMSSAERKQKSRLRQATQSAQDRSAVEIISMVNNHIRGPDDMVQQYLNTVYTRAEKDEYLHEYQQLVHSYNNAADDQQQARIFATIENKLKDLILKAIDAKALAQGDNRQLRFNVKQTFENLCADEQASRDKTMYELLDEAVAAVDKVNMLLGLTTTEFGRLRDSLKSQLNKKILGHELRSADENALRTLGRIPYHLRQQDEDHRATRADGVPIFQSMENLYPQLRKEFIAPPTTAIEDWLYDDDDANSDVDMPSAPRTSLSSQMDDINPEELESDSERSANGGSSLGHDEYEEQNRLQLDAQDENRLNREISQIVGDDVMYEVEDDVALAALRSTTFIRRCDNSCPKCSPRQAGHIRRRLLDFVDPVPMDLGQKTVETILELFDQSLPETGGRYSVVQWLKRYQPCYQGMRSVVQRLTDMLAVAKYIAAIRRFITYSDYDALKDVLAFSNTPARIRLQFLYKYTGHIADQHHHEEYVKNKWNAYLREFHEAMNELEIFTCQCCNQLRSQKYIRLYPTNEDGTGPTGDLLPYLPLDANNQPPAPAYTSREAMQEESRRLRSPSPPRVQTVPTQATQATQQGRRKRATQAATEKSYGICLTCHESIRKRQMPADALINGMASSPVPDCLTDLSYMEKMLIQRVRPIHSVFHLFTKNTDRLTAFKGTKGAQVNVSTDIEATVDNLVDTLPSASKLHIEVRTSFGDTQIVNLPKVLTALNYLKTNNEQYHDIVINPAFKFEVGENVHFEKPNATDADAEQLVHRNLDEPDRTHLLTQDAIRVQPYVDAEPPRINPITPQERFRLVPHPYRPMAVDTPHLDELSMPPLHPEGKYGYSHPRNPKLDISRYVRNRILDADRRYASDPTWLIFFYHHLLQKDITSVLGINARIAPTETGPQIAAKINDPSSGFAKTNMTAAFTKLKGFPPYWQQVKHKLKMHLIAFGEPTWFMTLNPAERNWKTVKNVYRRFRRIRGLPVSYVSISEQISGDSLHFCRYFYRRVRTFMSKCLKAGQDIEGPIGDIPHWFIRFEYQQRGLPHAHLILWSKDRPGPKATEAEIKAFLDKYLTCRMPDPDTEPILHELVKNHQLHWDKHNKTCLRKVRYGRGKRNMTSRCRFDMPRPALAETVVTHLNPHVRHLPGIDKRSYYLRRRATERMINDYNPAVLMAWKGNVDLQFIMGGHEVVMSYVTNYTTKSSSSDPRGVIGGEEAAKKAAADNKKKLPNEDSYAADDEDDLKMGGPIPKSHDPDGRLNSTFKQMIRMSQQRPVGQLEITDQLIGHKSYDFDCEHVWIDLHSSAERTRMLLAKKALERAAIPYHSNWNDDYYPQRPTEFENYSLCNMMTRFEVIDAARTRAGQQQTQLLDTTATGDEENRNLGNISSDDAIDDDADEKRARKSRIHQIAAAAKQRDVYSGHYNVSKPESPFYCHPDIIIGDSYPLEVRGNADRKVMRKKKAMCARCFFPHLNWDDRDSVEEFHRRQCMLFIPWRDEAALLGEADSWEQRWDEWYKELKKRSSRAAADIDKFMDRFIAVKKEDQARADKYREIKDALQAVGIEEQDRDEHGRTHRPGHRGPEDPRFPERPEEVAESYGRLVNVEQHRQRMEQLKSNPAQWRVVNGALEHARKQAAQRARGDAVDPPILLYVSGTAGTGKSFAINTLTDEASLEFIPDVASREGGLMPAVLLSAPTGLAGSNIGGLTVHNLLAIRVYEEVIRFGTSVSDMVLERKRALFKNVRILIVDEISMCSAVLLWQINQNLQKIMGTTELFGGINVVVFGDFLQLGPIDFHPVYELPEDRCLRTLLGGAPGAKVNLWHLFKYEELTVNQRQRGDPQFGDIMLRMREGQLKEEDVEVLADRIIPTTGRGRIASQDEVMDYFFNVLAEDPKTMAIFSRRVEVDAFNNKVMERLDTVNMKLYCSDVDIRNKHQFIRARAFEVSRHIRHRIHQTKAMDIEDNQLERKMKFPTKVPKATTTSYKDGSYDLPTEVDGLRDCLIIGIGTRVMLRHNIDSSRGLINGAVGTVTGFPLLDGQVYAVEVCFDNSGRTFQIRRCSQEYNRAVSRVNRVFEKRCRTQFPLTVCYAATVHKVQGMTLQNVLISTASIFAAGQMFVAFSRATSLKGIHLMDLFIDNVMVDPKAVAEYNRLRATLPADRRLPPMKMPLDCHQKPRSNPQKISAFMPRESMLQPLPANSAEPPLPRLRPRDGPTQQPNYADKMEDADSSEESDLISSGSSNEFKMPKRQQSSDDDGSIQSAAGNTPMEERILTQRELRELTQSTVKRPRMTRLIEMRQFLPMANPVLITADRKKQQTSCYIISAVNILNQMVELVQELLEEPLNPESSEVLRQLVRIFAGRSADGVQLLRTMLPDRFRAGYGSPHEAATLLLGTVPERIRKLATFQEGTVHVCNRCGQKHSKSTTTPTERWMFDLNFRLISKSRVSLEDAFKAQTMPYPSRRKLICEVDGCGGEIISRRSIHCLAENKYLLVAPIWDDEPSGDYKTELVGYSKDGNTFLGYQWHLVGLSELVKIRPGCSHYRTWFVAPEGTGGYVVVDDDKLEQKAQMEPHLLNRAQLFLFARKAQIRQTKKTTETQYLPRITEPPRSPSPQMSMDANQSQSTTSTGGSFPPPPAATESAAAAATNSSSSAFVFPVAQLTGNVKKPQAHLHPRPTTLVDIANDRTAQTVAFEFADVFNMQADAVLNNTNNFLVPGRGYGHLISMHAGDQLEKTLSEVRETRLGGKPLAREQVAVTDSFGLSTNYKVIAHAAAPQLTGDYLPSAEQMAVYMKIYVNVIGRIDVNGMQSIVCPAIGTGSHLWPKHLATLLALIASMEYYRWHPQTRITRIVIADNKRNSYDSIKTGYIEGEPIWATTPGNNAYWKQSIRCLLAAHENVQMKELLKSAGNCFIEMMCKQAAAIQRVPTVAAAYQQATRILNYIPSDIYRYQADCIVNATNRELNAGADGYDRELRKRAGEPHITMEIDRLKSVQLHGESMTATDALVTPSYRLAPNYKAIIHVAAPRITTDRAPTSQEMVDLVKCYIAAFKAADQRGYVSLATPLLGTGGHSWPKQLGTSLAALAAMIFFRLYSQNLKNIFMVENSQSDYNTVLAECFGGNSKWTEKDDGKQYWAAEANKLIREHSDRAVGYCLLETGCKYEGFVVPVPASPKQQQQPQMPVPSAPHVSSITIGYQREDVFKYSADAIINAANNRLQPGKGFDEILRNKAGPDLTKETSQKINRLPGGILDYGCVVKTGSYLLGNKYKSILHVAAPQLPSKSYQPTVDDIENLLKTYVGAFRTLHLLKYTSIVSPILGTGLYNWNKELGTVMAVIAAVIFAALHPQTTVTSIRFFEVSSKHFKNVYKKCFNCNNTWNRNTKDEWIMVIEQIKRSISKHDDLKHLLPAIDNAIYRAFTELPKAMERAAARAAAAATTTMTKTSVPPQAAPASVPPPPPSSSAFPVRERGAPPPLENLRNTCFANAVAQVFLQAWPTEIHTRNEPLMRELRRIELGAGPAELNAYRLVQQFSGADLPQTATRENFADPYRHHDSLEYMEYLFDRKHVPEDLRGQMAFDQFSSLQCEDCHTVSASGGLQETTSITVTFDEDAYTFPNFADIMAVVEGAQRVQMRPTPPQEMARRGLPPQHTPTCRPRHADGNCWFKQFPGYQIRDSTQFLTFRLQLAGWSRRHNRAEFIRDRSIGHPKRVETFQGVDFTPIAAIQHLGADTEHGHYIAYVRKGNDWYICDDHRIRKQALPNGLSGIVMMMFKRI